MGERWTLIGWIQAPYYTCHAASNQKWKQIYTFSTFALKAAMRSSSEPGTSFMFIGEIEAKLWVYFNVLHT